MKNYWTKFLFPVSITGMIILSNCSQGGSTPESPVTTTEADPMKDKGIGPVTSITLGQLDSSMVTDGKKIYNTKCTACHNPTQKLIGPPQKGVLQRRTAEWTMNMILNTQEMLDKDPVAQKLLKEFNNIPMTNQNLSQDDARKVLEYLRSL